MPHDLFGDVAARPQSVRSRRSPLVFASLGVHGALVLGLVVLSIVTPEALPFPSHGFCFCDFNSVDITLPKISSDVTRPDRGKKSDLPAASEPRRSDVAPTEVSDRISPDGTGGGPEDGDGGGGRGLVEPPHSPIAGGGLPQVAEAPPPPPTAPVRLHSGIRAPRRLNDVAPVYPAIARNAHVEGVVILEATIDAAGTLQSARVLRSIPLLDEAAMDAVRQWRYEPALLNGQPVAVIMTVTVQFTLNR